jgi:hypothetical protein
MYIGVWWENMKEMNCLEVLDIDVTILQLLLNKYGGRIWIGFIWLRIGPAAGCICMWC